MWYQIANAQTIPYLIHQHLGKYLYQFNQDEVLDAMRGFSLRNIKLSNQEAKALQTFLSSSTFSTVARVNTVCTLPIFSVIQDTGVCQSINSIKTAYYKNKAIAESESFDLRRDLLSNSPLVISRYNNNMRMISKLCQLSMLLSLIK